MIDVRFPTALHLMLSLAFAHAEGVAQLSSSQLANGVGANRALYASCWFPWPTLGSSIQRMAAMAASALAARPTSITLLEIYSARDRRKEPLGARAVPHQCLVSSNVERYFVGLAAKADNAVLKTLEHKTLAESLAEIRTLDAIQ